MSGGFITVALGVYERLYGTPVALWIYASVLNLFILFGCYLAWRDSRMELIEKTTLLEAGRKDARKREYVIERLKGFIQEGLEIQSWGGLSTHNIGNWGKLSVMGSYPERVEIFLRDHLGEPYALRYKEKGKEVLDEIVKELLN